MGVLAIISSAVGHKFVVSPKEGWRESINLYIACGSEPGTRKSPTLKKLVRPLDEWEDEQNKILGPEIKKIISKRKSCERVIEKRRSSLNSIKDRDEMKMEIHKIAEEEANLIAPPALPKIYITDRKSVV